VELNLGLGGGLTPSSAGLVGKIILGYTLDVPKLRGHARPAERPQ
jgi:hypothetical protein